MLDSSYQSFRPHEKPNCNRINSQLLFILLQIPSDIIYITSVRSFAVLITLTSAIVLTMSIVYRPWRIEYTSKKVQLEISIWDVCRVVKANGEKCYPGEYSDAPGKELNTYSLDTGRKLSILDVF